MITKKPENLVLGMTALLVGGGFLLDTLGVITFGELFGTWWPVLLWVFALVSVWSNRDNWLWAVLWALAGTLLLMNNLDLVTFNVWNLFWPLVIIGVGLALIFNKSHTRMKVGKAKRVDLAAVLGATEQKNDSQEFAGSKITSVMGSAVLDLRKAKMQKEVVIEVMTFWGSVEIYLPNDVEVRNEIMPVLGAVESKVDQTTKPGSPVVTIIGQAIMAGVEIRN